VRDGLSAGFGGVLRPGWLIGGPVSGSLNADHGTHMSGTYPNIQCTFWRRHHAFHIQANANLDTWNAGLIWSQSPHAHGGV